MKEVTLTFTLQVKDEDWNNVAKRRELMKIAKDVNSAVADVVFHSRNPEREGDEQEEYRVEWQIKNMGD